jgi:riboflavin synthase
MFTGLVERVAEIVESKPTSAGIRLRIASSLASELTAGESVAVNGVCLTVIHAKDTEILFDVGPETVRVTTLGTLGPAALVNLERPLRADGRIGGHFVQGHVDGIGCVEEFREQGDSYWLTVSVPHVLAPYIIPKGSIAIDGISLTVAGLGKGRIDVMVLAYTMENTNARAMKAGDRVNLECDMIGKYVVRAVELAGLTLTATKAGEVTH